MKPRLVTDTATSDPLAEARSAANAEIDAMLDAWAVSLMHADRAERFRELLQPGVMQLAEQIGRSIRATTLAISAIRGRS